MAYSDNPEVASSYSFQIYVSSHTADSKPVKPVKLVYTSDFGARFRSRLLRSSKYNYFYI